jgi:hypothetical protein
MALVQAYKLIQKPPTDSSRRLEFAVFDRWPDLLSGLGALIIISSALTVVLTKQAASPNTLGSVSPAAAYARVPVDEDAADLELQMSPSDHTVVKMSPSGTAPEASRT